MPTKFAQFIDPFLVAAETGSLNPDLFDLVSSVSKIHTIRVDIGNCGHRPKFESCSTERSANKQASAQSAMKSSRTITTWSPTIGIRREWAERGGTITLTTFRQYIGGVTKKRDQREWATNHSKAAITARSASSAGIFSCSSIHGPTVISCRAVFSPEVRCEVLAVESRLPGMARCFHRDQAV